MVFSDVPGLTKTRICKPIQSQLLFPTNPPDVVPLDHVELDFADVFGPLPVQTSSEMNHGDSGDSVSTSDTNDLMYGNPVVIYSRSHSLVGPYTCLSQSLKAGKLTLHEIEDSEEVVECDHEEAIKELRGTSSDDDFSEKSVKDIDSDSTKVQTVGLEDFEVLKHVGQGAFGKVFQVRKRNTSEIYAMKVMRKDKIMEKNHAEYMKAERDILTKVDHPFIVQLRYSFQTKYRLYLVLDFVNGGHLFFQLYNHGLFREDLARIYAAEIVSAVSHLHANGIMHRDLKPENILLDADGHAMLTDFGLAKEFDENTRSNSMCGTVEYMSPEICLGKGHDKAADWWSVGILLYEMLTGKPPFIGGNREKIQQKVIKDKIKLPGFLTSDAHSVLKGLLQKDPSKRLGSGPLGIDEIKCHKWFKPINWKKLEAREIQPSFRPEVDGELCIANFEKRWTDMPLADSPAASPTASGNIFTGFSYVKVGVQGAEECGDFEEWFNYRLSRAAPETCAEFLGSFIADQTNSQFTKGGKWLVWKFEGDRDLGDYMKDRNFPLNLESIMFGRVLQGLGSIERNALIIKQIMRQIITSLKKIHDTGIVHRDVKPSNLVVTKRGQIKLIDFGAATDLRIGKNYVPNRGLLDPDYCPPEQYVLPEETPIPPPEPIAAFLSPILWQLNSPDLFDMYSAGIVLMQMAVPSLRSTAGLKNFNLELKTVGYDLKRWREYTRFRPDLTILDLDSGRGWDLATKLISKRGFFRRGRLSAAAALRHPYFLLGGDQAAAVLSKLSLTK